MSHPSPQTLPCLAPLPFCSSLFYLCPSFILLSPTCLLGTHWTLSGPLHWLFPEPRMCFPRNQHACSFCSTVTSSEKLSMVTLSSVTFPFCHSLSPYPASFFYIALITAWQMFMYLLVYCFFLPIRLQSPWGEDLTLVCAGSSVSSTVPGSV